MERSLENTSCRIVLDAFKLTVSGLSFNDTLAKKKKKMNTLVEIAICWASRETPFHTDVKKLQLCEVRSYIRTILATIPDNFNNVMKF